MIKEFIITGDCHREFSRFKNYPEEIQNNPEVAVIILGDAGINYTLNKYDNDIKDYLTKNYKFRIYCVRGNHEARPQNIQNMKLVYDEDVCGDVYMEEAWPQIRYFKDWGIYQLGEYRAAVIGGAYSVDKEYRLMRGSGWFEDEQLSTDEMLECTRDFMGEEVDLVLSHTCPICWEPRDLFLSGINQSNVDKSMELFLEEILKVFRWKILLFGHYHADRIERPGVEQFYKNTENIKTIVDRWNTYNKTGELDWWLVKSPQFYYNDKIQQGDYFEDET